MILSFFFFNCTISQYCYGWIYWVRMRYGQIMGYLTNVWKLDSTDAAAIVNFFWALIALLPLLQAFLVDTIMGNFPMLLISSISLSTVIPLTVPLQSIELKRLRSDLENDNYSSF